MITITQDNIYKSDFSIVDMRKHEELETISESEIVRYLSDEIELGESVTFERIFEIISENVKYFQEIFYSCLGGYSLELFIDEIEELPTEKSDLLYLEVYWICDKYDGDLSIVSNLHGIGIQNEDDGSFYKKGDILPYAIEFTPLNNLKYLKVKLNYELKVVEFNSENKKSIHIDMGNKSFTVFDFFYSILYEISWNGDPTERIERFKEIEESIKISEEELKEAKTKVINSEDLFEEIDRNDIYLVKYKKLRDRLDEELCEGISKLEPLKNCLLEKLKFYDEIENSSEGDDLTKYAKKLSDVEFNLQLLYGVDEDSKYHRFWETPKCTCPKIDNVVKFPNGGYIKYKDCPIHGTKKEKI